MLNILYAEDVLIVRQRYAEYLRQLGYSVTEVKDGIEALYYLKKDKYDIILLDINMPRMNGIDFLSALKSIEYRSYIIMCTGNSYTETLKKCLELGINDFIVKPIDEARLKQAILKATAKLNKQQI